VALSTLAQKDSIGEGSLSCSSVSIMFMVVMGGPSTCKYSIFNNILSQKSILYYSETEILVKNA